MCQWLFKSIIYISGTISSLISLNGIILSSPFLNIYIYIYFLYLFPYGFCIINKASVVADLGERYIAYLQWLCRKHGELYV